jgi:hypothetical protein
MRDYQLNGADTASCGHGIAALAPLDGQNDDPITTGAKLRIYTIFNFFFNSSISPYHHFPQVVGTTHLAVRYGYSCHINSHINILTFFPC